MTTKKYHDFLQFQELLGVYSQKLDTYTKQVLKLCRKKRYNARMDRYQPTYLMELKAHVLKQNIIDMPMKIKEFRQECEKQRQKARTEKRKKRLTEIIAEMDAMLAQMQSWPRV